MYKCFNKGISYVELILVIAIMAILSGLISISIGTINGNNVSKAADIAASAINEARISSLTKGSNLGYVSFAVRNGNYYYYVGKSATVSDISASDFGWNKVCNGTVDVYFSEEDPTTSGSLGDQLVNNKILGCGFRQSNGQLCNSEHFKYQYVTFVHGNKSATVRIYPISGKCEVLY